MPVLLTLLVAPASFAQDEAPRQRVAGDILCDDDLLICRESCSMELGTRAQNRERVAKCLYRCEQSHTVCLQRVIARRKAAPRATEAPEKKKPVEKEEHFSGAPTRFSQEEAKPSAEAPAEEEVAPVRRSVTRSTELEAAPDRSMVDYPERAGVVTKARPRMERPPEEPEEEAPPVRTPPPADPAETNELGY